MTSGQAHIALTIAGSDSGGGAGIQADLKTFEAWGVFGTSAVVAITAQNTLGVRAVHPVPLHVVTAQLDALAEDLPPEALKTGMLATRELVLLVAEAIADRGWTRYVLDPVMVATSGDRLLDADAVSAVRDRLVPLAACVTPNLDEAELLVGVPVRDPKAMQRAGEALVALGAGAALVKGG
ncbi:MAG TPA: bifunctional hydroxymethylpyrimidine kinase/phosphomethylpyrimidine kinase, partial [Gemmatimonadales bacterium]|nr:bifunctional hydroxymethylpyrimidine kinase/phosphomethylpyrimidine kinase [Gemmatimonadales bacterium]